MAWSTLQNYNVIYTVPGQTDRSAMPIGDGELCASVWVDEEGKIRFYFGRTDCLGENDLTMKHGMITIETTPGFLEEGGYRQTLILEEGRIEIESNLGKIHLYISNQNHTIYAVGKFKKDVVTTIHYYTWRTKDKNTVYNQWFSPWLQPTIVKADVVECGKDILFYHQNGENGIQKLAKFEGVKDVSKVPDFLTNRIFGGVMELKDSVPCGQGLQTVGNQMELRITTLSGQYNSVTDWKQELLERQKNNISADEARNYVSSSWKSFWEESYIYVSGDEPRTPSCTSDILERAKETQECNEVPSTVTQAYLLTKYMFACCKDGNFPILYNGLLFNLTPGNEEHLQVETFAGTFTSQPKGVNEEYNPDERSWSIEQLWQNLRLPYYTMLHTGDFDSLRKMFQYYLRFQDLNEQRAAAYFGAKGIHNVEMTLSCGLMTVGIYGKDRTGKQLGEAENSWGGSIQISPGLELLNLMLEYCRYTDDVMFLQQEVISYARKTYDYIATRFGRDEKGKIYISDINCIETYFHTTNPVTIIAGMHSTLQKLIGMDIPQMDREYFEGILAITPEIPMQIWGDKQLISPAKEYEEDRKNIELPELYTVYPFGLYGKVIGNEKVAVDTFQEITTRYGFMKPHTIGMPPGSVSYSGWHYIGNSAAILGLTEVCKEVLENNAALKNPGNRFPAMWGAVHDAVPDVDHGANIMNQLQLMVLQCEGEELHLLPAFPENWSVKFRLHAPHNTIVEGQYENGKWISLKMMSKK